MKFFRLFLIAIVLSCLSCKRNKDNDLIDVTTLTHSEREINLAFEQIVKKDNIPMDSLQKVFQQLDSLNSKKEYFDIRKDIIRGTYYRKNAAFELAKIFYHKSLENLKPSDSLANYAFVGLGLTYRHLGDFDKSLNFFQKSITNCKQRNDTVNLAGTYASMAQMYFEKEDIPKAIESNNKVFSLLKNKHTERPYLIALHSMANISGESGNLQKALEYDKEGLKLANQLNDDAIKTSFQDNLALCNLFLIKDYDKAIYYLIENLKIDKRLKNQVWIADTYINIAEVLMAEKSYKNAKIYLDSALVISTKNNQLGNSLKVYKVLSDFYSEQNDYKQALEAKDNYIKIYKNSINEESEQAFAAYKVIYETGKKEKEIAEGKLASKQKNMWLILLGSFLIIGFAIFWNFRFREKHKQRQLLLENELLKEQAHSKIQEQRLEISRDLHDSLGAQLTFISSTLDILKRHSLEMNENIIKKINILSDFSENSIIELKNTLWALSAEELNLEDLKIKILNFIRNASDAKENVKFNFNFEISQNIQIKSKQAINLFRVIQEITNNALKHSQATEINIDIQQNENQLIIKIADNGKGFDYEIEKNKSFGLMNIENRITAIGGIIATETEKGKGTVYTIQIEL